MEARFEALGPAGLEDQGGKKMALGSNLPEVTKRTILMLKKANPEWRCQRISDVLYPGAGASRSGWDRHKGAANNGNRGQGRAIRFPSEKGGCSLTPFAHGGRHRSFAARISSGRLAGELAHGAPLIDRLHELHGHSSFKAERTREGFHQSCSSRPIGRSKTTADSDRRTSRGFHFFSSAPPSTRASSQGTPRI